MERESHLSRLFSNWMVVFSLLGIFPAYPNDKNASTIFRIESILLIGKMTKQPQEDKLLFDVDTPLGFRVRLSVDYWHIITTMKHPAVLGRETDVQRTLQHPCEVRRSKSDPHLYLFYRSDGEKRWICSVAKRLNGDGFLVTSYRTSNIKEGERIWPL